MSHTRYLKELLSPMGIYDVDGVFHGGELAAVGQALDQVMGRLDEIQKEMSLVTAEDWGLARVADTLSVSPVADTTRGYALAMAALLRIGGDSFTVDSIADTVKGCGILAEVTEQKPIGTLSVTFPNVAGVPVGFPKIKEIITGILPAQAEVIFDFWYQTWGMVGAVNTTWMDVTNSTWYVFATEGI